MNMAAGTSQPTTQTPSRFAQAPSIPPQTAPWYLQAPLQCYRLVGTIAARFANRRFIFTFAALPLLGAKFIHIYSHISSLPSRDLERWGYTFFFQDIVLILALRLILANRPFEIPAWLQLVVTTTTSALISYITFLSLSSIAFFIVCGVEIHWRNITLAGDASSWALLLTGLLTFAIVCGVFLLAAWIMQDLCYAAAGLALETMALPFTYVLRKTPLYQRWGQTPTSYSAVGQEEFEIMGKDEEAQLETNQPPKSSPRFKRYLYAVTAFLLALQVVLLAIRPGKSSLVFLSWTAPLLPFIDFTSTFTNLVNLREYHHSGIGSSWDDFSSLTDVPSFPWLSNEIELAGFSDWYQNKQHYNAEADMLKISNLDSDLLPDLRSKLADVNIRHVMLILLESTRKDVFPFKRDSFLWERLSSTFESGELPDEAKERLATLTPNANYLTGDYEDGFEHLGEKKRRGGVNFNNAYTSATYTIKSMLSTLCGISPVIGDFNMEYKHHIYQPCLPQLLKALNEIPATPDNDAKNYSSFKWQSSFMMTSTFDYDHTNELMGQLGYDADKLISREYLRRDDAKFGRVDLPDLNYFSFSELPLEDYIRDAFSTAREEDERVFLTHLTSTSHHDFKIPQSEKYVQVDKKSEDLSHYMNAIGYDDRWLGRILNALDEEGVANETLVVLVGDHGLTMPENDIVSPYYNPNVGVFNVPLVFSHPGLPVIDVQDPVVSMQILPTILDLLLETKSVAKSQLQAARQLLENYEGQSLMRPHILENNNTKQGDWQFTIINPGGAMVSARDPRKPTWHMTVPIIDTVEWRFTDTSTDRAEAHPTFGFDFGSFLRRVEDEHGLDAAKWAEEGAFVARWWVREQNKRWRYGPYSEE